MKLIDINIKKPSVGKDVLLKCDSYYIVGYKVMEEEDIYKDMQYNYHYPISWCELPED